MRPLVSHRAVRTIVAASARAVRTRGGFHEREHRLQLRVVSTRANQIHLETPRFLATVGVHQRDPAPFSALDKVVADGLARGDALAIRADTTEHARLPPTHDGGVACHGEELYHVVVETAWRTLRWLRWQIDGRRLDREELVLTLRVPSLDCLPHSELHGELHSE